MARLRVTWAQNTVRLYLTQRLPVLLGPTRSSWEFFLLETLTPGTPPATLSSTVSLEFASGNALSSDFWFEGPCLATLWGSHLLRLGLSLWLPADFLLSCPPSLSSLNPFSVGLRSDSRQTTVKSLHPLSLHPRASRCAGQRPRALSDKLLQVPLRLSSPC